MLELVYVQSVYCAFGINFSPLVNLWVFCPGMDSSAMLTTPQTVL